MRVLISCLPELRAACNNMKTREDEEAKKNFFAIETPMIRGIS